jgi:hypothetical protein
MDDSRTGALATQQDLHPTRIGSILASVDDGALTAHPHLRRLDGGEVATIRALARSLPQNQPEIEKHAAEKTQPSSRIAGQPSKFWNYDRFRR